MSQCKLIDLIKIVWIFGCLNFCVGVHSDDKVNYCRKSESNLHDCESIVGLYANRLNYDGTVRPYQYNHFDFCPADETSSADKNLGQVIVEDRIRLASYKIEFLKDVQCEKVCTREYVGGNPESTKHLKTLKKGMILNYEHDWIVDNVDVPLLWCYPIGNGRIACSHSFPMGCFVRPDANGFETCQNYTKPGFYYPFNHVDFTITYKNGEGEEWDDGFGANGGRIISVAVVPVSINHRNPEKLDCLRSEPLEIPARALNDGEKLNITYTYSVKFVEINEDEWSYILIMVFLLFLLTGIIGFLACFWFIRKNHNAVETENNKKIFT